MKRSLRTHPAVFLLLLVGISGTHRSQTQRPPASQASEASQALSTASIEGTLVRLGTNDPITGADVELTRLEGTASSPLTSGAAEAFASLRDAPASVGAAPPAPLAAEIQYARTGENGRFTFRNLKPGGYRLVAVVVGGDYYPAEYGQRDPRARGLIFPVAEGEARRDVKLEMAATGVITGRIRDTDGEPLGPLTVLATQFVYEDGRRTLRITRGVMADDRGNYRLYWLPPGRYFIAARVEDPKRRATTVYIGQPGRYRGTLSAEAPVVSRQILPDGTTADETYGLMYFGGVLDPEKAQPIDLPSGGSFAGADIFLGAAKLRAHHIRGTLFNTVNGQPFPGVEVRAIPLEPSPSLIIPSATTDSQGAFDIAGVVPGRYALVTSSLPIIGPVTTAVRGMPNPAAFAVIEVGDRDIDNLTLPAMPPIDVAGRVIVEGQSTGGKDLDLSKVRVRLTRDPDLLGMPAFAGGPAQDLLKSGGAFTLQILPGDFRVVVGGLPPEGYVKSIRLGSEDVLANGLHIRNGSPVSPLDIVVGTDAGEVAGTGVDSRLEPLPNAVVVLIPVQGAVRPGASVSTTTDAAGRFTIRSVPPGDYKLFAWEYVEPGSWDSEAFLKPYEAFGKSMRVAGSSRQEVQLRVAPLR